MHLSLRLAFARTSCTPHDTLCTYEVKQLRLQGFSLIWSECNYRISENTDISMVCWQSARGIYSKRLKFRGIPLKSEFERSFPQG